MTADGMYIDEQSLRKLGLNIRLFKATVLRDALDGLKAFGLRILNQARTNLVNNGSIGSRERPLWKSGNVKANPDNTVDVGFYMRYAQYVEFGRPKGKQPPVEALYEWVKFKKRVNNPEPKKSKKAKADDFDAQAWRAAWALAIDIKNRGTKPHPYLKPAYELYRGKIDAYMQGVVNKTLENFRPKK